MAGRSGPAFRAPTASAALFPFPHQVCPQFDESAVVSADVIGFERRAIVGPEPVAVVNALSAPAIQMAAARLAVRIGCVRS